MEIYIACGFCTNKIEKTTTLRSDWKRVKDVCIEDALCPKHSLIEKFIDSQCPGCVSAWGDCGLWESFAYSGRRRDITEEDFSKIRVGICPRRVNGTLFVNSDSKEVKNIDLSEKAPTEAGVLLEKTIREYLEEYPSE